MLGTQDLILFVGAIIMLSVIPGPDMLYVVSRSVAQGRMAGVASVLGIGSALFCHGIIVAFGLSTLLATSQFAFDLIKYLGAAYLLYLAVQAWLQSSPMPAIKNVSNSNLTNLSKIYRQGFVTGILNPKTTIFFAALLPQFVQSGESHSPVPFLFLGVLVVIVGSTCDLTVALLSGSFSRNLRSNVIFTSWIKKITSFVYIGLALNLLRLRNGPTEA